MKQLHKQHRIRYPPFEAARWAPETLPIAVRQFSLGEYETKEAAKEAIKDEAPSFRLGLNDGWIIERSYRYGEETLEVKFDETHLESEGYVQAVKKQRQGWYLIPNPIHHILRQFINGVVIVLLVCLFYLFISPVLLFMNLPVYGLETVRWGLLDYPALAVFVVPLIFAPLFIRVVANLLELQRQKQFLKRNLQTPVVEFIQPSVANKTLELKVSFPEWDPTWNHVDAILRVGALPPSRESLLETLDRSPTRQPPPGLSTELPHHWQIGLDDGTAGGEDAPMELKEVKGGLYLRPMRIMVQGAPQRWQEGEVLKLEPPKPAWPGSVHTELLRVHWECILRIDRQRGGALLWVQPLKVAHSQQSTPLEHLPLHDGRSELDLT
ncbi:MAG TPA: hypothetical protein D7H91_03945 [Candidatus Poseidoniales archaeon]|nr:MAG TPA: hypothetical protein D7H91_03945 [Candidatus Poseidoniales archaeon]HII78171.1 hypothetical protein [Poseidonia sp.]